MAKTPTENTETHTHLAPTASGENSVISSQFSAAANPAGVSIEPVTPNGPAALGTPTVQTIPTSDLDPETNTLGTYVDAAAPMNTAGVLNGEKREHDTTTLYSDGWNPNYINPHQGWDFRDIFSNFGNFFNYLFNAIAGPLTGDTMGFDILNQALMGPDLSAPYGVGKDGKPLASPFTNTGVNPEVAENTTPEDFGKNYLSQNDALNNMFTFIMNLEQDEVVEEPDGGYSKYGINTRWHQKPHEGEEAAAYKERATEWLDNLKMADVLTIFKEEYAQKIDWSIIGVDKNDPAQMANVPLGLQLAVIDTAFHCDPSDANRMLKDAYEKNGNTLDGLTEAVIKERQDHNAGLIANEPDTYKKFENGWDNRISQLRERIGELDAINQAIAFQPVDNETLHLSRPVEDDHEISDTFRYRHKHPVEGRPPSMHRGADIAAPIGTDLEAQAQGRVVYAGTSQGYGNIVVVHYGNGVYTMDAHLDNDNVKTGDLLEVGQKYAETGNTGIGSGAHLHAEVWIQRGNQAITIDPQEAWKAGNLFDQNTQEHLIADAFAKAPEGTLATSNAFVERVLKNGMAYNPDRPDEQLLASASIPTNTGP